MASFFPLLRAIWMSIMGISAIAFGLLILAGHPFTIGRKQY